MTRCLANVTLLDLRRRRIAVFSKLETGVAKILQQSVALKVLPSNIALRRVCRVFMFFMFLCFYPCLMQVYSETSTQFIITSKRPLVLKEHCKEDPGGNLRISRNFLL